MRVGGRSKGAVRWRQQRVPLAEDKEPAGRRSFKTGKGELVIDK